MEFLIGVAMMLFGAFVQHKFFERKPDKYDLPHQEYHELKHMPMGEVTYLVACALCKNGPYTDGICGDCKCEYRSYWEPDQKKFAKVFDI